MIRYLLKKVKREIDGNDPHPRARLYARALSPAGHAVRTGRQGRPQKTTERAQISEEARLLSLARMPAVARVREDGCRASSRKIGQGAQRRCKGLHEASGWQTQEGPTGLDPGMGGIEWPLDSIHQRHTRVAQLSYRELLDTVLKRGPGRCQPRGFA